MGFEENIDRELSNAINDGVAPGVVAIVVNKNQTLYEKSFGVQSLRTQLPMEIDSIFNIASMTKPIAALGCMRAVEQGLLHLDQNAGELIPWLDEVQVLEGFGSSGEPLLRNARTYITLRKLLTHTSGFVYEIWNSNQNKYLQFADTGTGAVRSGAIESLKQPLAFEPGEKWGYGPGIDWATQLLEVATGLPLGKYLESEIFKPLGMNDTSFEPIRVDERKFGRRAALHRSTLNGYKAMKDGTLDRASSREFDGGGGGLYSTAADYGKFMKTLLNEGKFEEKHILSSETVKLMSENQLGELRVPPMLSTDYFLSADTDFLPGIEKSWGLSFLINEENNPGGRDKGSLSWAGLCNTYFWIDSTNEIAAALLCQVLPFAHPPVIELLSRFEKAIYKNL
jgi:CubicO group peptidase (beta-lactamase class C family)|tara:strand:+ start:3570 stop:4757 length:1188 start_codon:yes stop_codon:yes gene_type:complete